MFMYCNVFSWFDGVYGVCIQLFVVVVFSNVSVNVSCNVSVVMLKELK